MMYDNNRQSPYRRNLYDDVKYQIDTFNKCWEKRKSKSLTPSLHHLITLSPQHFHTNSNLIELTGNNSTDQTEVYFKCLTQKEFTGRLTPPYVLHSIYIHQVRNFLRYFPRNQILLLKSEGICSLQFVWLAAVWREFMCCVSESVLVKSDLLTFLL